MSNPYAVTSEASRSTGTPTVRPISWPATAIHLGLLLIIAVVCLGWFRSPPGMVYSTGAYLLYSLGSRFLIARAHRKGIQLSRSGQYEKAIEAFDESYQFFSRHAWLDRFRAVTLLSAAAMSYREMALCNIGFAYSQLGDGLKAKQVFQRTLNEFPNSAMATASLRMLQAGESIRA
jgi:tetratricopeptide (TPR) repeat protein